MPRSLECDLQRKMTGFLRRYLTLAFARRRRPRKRSFTQQLVGRRGWHYLRMPTAFCRSHPRLVPMNTQSGILCDPASLVLYGRCRASSRPHARSRKGESRRTLSEPFSPFESKLMYNPPMQGIPWSTIALGSLLLISARSIRRTGRAISAT